MPTQLTFSSTKPSAFPKRPRQMTFGSAYPGFLPKTSTSSSPEMSELFQKLYGQQPALPAYDPSSSGLPVLNTSNLPSMRFNGASALSAVPSKGTLSLGNGNAISGHVGNVLGGGDLNNLYDLPYADITDSGSGASDGIDWSPITRSKPSGASSAGASIPGSGAGAGGAGASPSVSTAPSTPGAGQGSLGGLFSKLAHPNFSYNWKSGLQGYGKNLGKVATGATAAIQGIKALQGISDLSDAKSASEDLASDIVTASYNNPMLQYDLDPEQLSMLRDLRRGTYDNSVGISDVSLLGVLGDVLKGGLYGAGGGIPGMIAGAIGGGVNSVIGDLGQARENSNAELEALYQSILESEQGVNNIKKQKALANFAAY